LEHLNIFLKHQGITRVGNLLIYRIFDEIKEGIQQGVAQTLGRLLGISIQVG